VTCEARHASDKILLPRIKNLPNNFAKGGESPAFSQLEGKTLFPRIKDLPKAKLCFQESKIREARLCFCLRQNQSPAHGPLYDTCIRLCPTHDFAKGKCLHLFATYDINIQTNRKCSLLFLAYFIIFFTTITG
jgi:hypothetical protein